MRFLEGRGRDGLVFSPHTPTPSPAAPNAAAGSP